MSLCCTLAGYDRDVTHSRAREEGPMIRDFSRTVKADTAFPGLISSKCGNDVCDLSAVGTLGWHRSNVSRLLLILTEFPPSFGGMQTHAIHLCRYLHQHGYQI